MDVSSRVYFYSSISFKVLSTSTRRPSCNSGNCIRLNKHRIILHEIENNLEVILLLVFMVAGIFFMKNLMLTIFTKLLLKVKSKTYLSLLFCISAAVLSAFLDALTVTAVLIGVTIGFYRVFHTVSSGKAFSDSITII